MGRRRGIGDRVWGIGCGKIHVPYCHCEGVFDCGNLGCVLIIRMGTTPRNGRNDNFVCLTYSLMHSSTYQLSSLHVL